MIDMAMSKEEKKVMITAMIAYPFIFIATHDWRLKMRRRIRNRISESRGGEEPEIDIVGDPQGQ